MTRILSSVAFAVLTLPSGAWACTSSGGSVIRPFTEPAGDSSVFLIGYTSPEVALFEVGGAEIPGSLAPLPHDGIVTFQWSPDTAVALGTEVELMVEGFQAGTWTIERAAVGTTVPDASLVAEQLLPFTYGSGCANLDHGVLLRSSADSVDDVDVALFEVELDETDDFADPENRITQFGGYFAVVPDEPFWARGRAISWDGSRGPWTDPVPFTWVPVDDTADPGDTGSQTVDSGGCGCNQGGMPSGLAWIAIAGLLARRRQG